MQLSRHACKAGLVHRSQPAACGVYHPAAYPSLQCSGRCYQHAAPNNSCSWRRAHTIAQSWPIGFPSSDVTSQKITFSAVTGALAKASNAWDSHDKDRNGTLCIDECTTLLNGEELQEALFTLTNIKFKPRTQEDIEPFFKRADADKSGSLSRTEFLALFLAVATHDVKTDPFMIAEALLGFIDLDRNGRIEGQELKKLLFLLGFAPVLMLPIPAELGVEYRPILDELRKITGHKRR